MRLEGQTAYRLGAALALVATFVIVWLNIGAGLIGIEDDDPANLLYVGVLVIGFVGAVAARLRPAGLAGALFATAVALAVVGVVALTLPNTASRAQIVLLHGALVAMFAGAAWLFRYVARRQPGREPLPG